MADEFCLKMPDFHVTFRHILHAVNLHGTNGFTSLPNEGVLRIFFALKNQTASAGFEPANLGTKGQRATSRPPMPLVTSVGNECNKFPDLGLVQFSIRCCKFELFYVVGLLILRC